MITDGVVFEDTVAVRTTARAILIRFNGRQFWVPLSQVTDRSEVRRAGDRGRLVVTRWWAGKADLLDLDAQAPSTTALTESTKTYRALAMEHHPAAVGMMVRS
jgi:hypothetical protein